MRIRCWCALKRDEEGLEGIFLVVGDKELLVSAAAGLWGEAGMVVMLIML
jgi:hypothetical protein